MADKKLSGKTALITGASKGLGRAMALALGAEGARLALVSRDVKQLEETASAVRGVGAEADVFRADITEKDRVVEVGTAVPPKVGKIRSRGNKGGVNVRKPVTDF